MGIVRQLIDAFSGVERHSVVDPFAVWRKAGAEPPTPPDGTPSIIRNLGKYSANGELFPQDIGQ